MKPVRQEESPDDFLGKSEEAMREEWRADALTQEFFKGLYDQAKIDFTAFVAAARGSSDPEVRGAFEKWIRNASILKVNKYKAGFGV